MKYRPPLVVARRSAARAMGAGEPRGIIIVIQGEEEEAAGARYV